MALAVGLAISPASLAETVLDEVGPGGSIMQGSVPGDIFQPEFALWPLTGNHDNNSDIRYDGNEAAGRGTADQPWLLGAGGGNVIQLSTGGNAFNPQVAAGGDNNSKIVTFGNWAEDNGKGESVTGGQVLGHIVDANGNVFQMEFFEGNVFNPQVALGGDNTSDINTIGNTAINNGGDTDGALAFVDANGNVVQIMILSHNVINPQVSVGGSNTVDIYSSGNTATGNGGDVQATGFAGFFSIVKVGNVTQIAILSNNVWAPQIVLPDFNGNGGTNTSHIITETNTAEADGIDVDLPGGTGGGPVDVGNIFQWAPLNGNISNNQWNFAHQSSTPDVVQEEEHEDVPPPPNPGPPALAGNELPNEVVTPSTASTGDEPEVILDSGNSGGSNPAGTHGNWKPGDGIKKVVAGVKQVATGIHNALHPKPAPTGGTPAGDGGPSGPPGGNDNTGP